MKEFVVGLDGSDQSRMSLRWAAASGQAADVPVRAVQSWSRANWCPSTATRPAPTARAAGHGLARAPSVIVTCRCLPARR